MNIDIDKLKAKKHKRPDVTNVRIKNKIYFKIKEFANKENIPTTKLINHMLEESFKELEKTKGE